jgi:hypothetical protein
MISDAHEAVGSMGDDTPPAVLSSRSRLFTDYFRQRFAQVTNPPVDPYRESSVMSLTTYIGAQGSYLDETAARPTRIGLRSPILTRSQLAQLQTASALAPVVVDTTFAVAGGSGEFTRQLDASTAAACQAVERGAALVILSDGNRVCSQGAAASAARGVGNPSCARRSRPADARQSRRRLGRGARRTSSGGALRVRGVGGVSVAWLCNCRKHRAS